MKQSGFLETEYYHGVGGGYGWGRKKGRKKEKKLNTIHIVMIYEKLWWYMPEPKGLV